MTTKRRSRSSFPRRFQGPRRRSAWEFGSIAQTTLAATVTALTDFTPNLIPTVGRKGHTIVRLIGHLLVSANVAGESQDFAAGFTLADAAESIDPQANLDEPWMWYVAGATSRNGIEVVTHIIDVKSKRRFMEDTDQLRFAIRNNDGSENMVYRVSVRMLTLLP